MMSLREGFTRHFEMSLRMAYYNSYSPLSLFIMFFSFFLFTFMTATTTTYTEGLQEDVPAVFVFGDSLIDVGNNNHLDLSILKANFPHNGIDFAGQEATGRYSNGKNAADFLAAKLRLATAPPFLSIEFESNKTSVVLDRGGINFASGGAGVLIDTSLLFRQSISMTKQIEYYASVHEELVQHLGTIGAETYLAKSVFFFAIGSNDILNLFKFSTINLRPKNSNDMQYISSLMLALKGQLKRICNLGARKFVVVGVGLIGCCPSLRSKNETGGCNEEANYWSVKYNEGLSSLLEELKTEHRDINYSLFFTYDLMVDFLQQPAHYGLSEVKSACCGLGKFKAQFPCLPIATYCKNRREHLFWDFYFPTEATAEIVVDTFFNGSPQKYVRPINLKQLVAI